MTCGSFLLNPGWYTRKPKLTFTLKFLCVCIAVSFFFLGRAISRLFGPFRTEVKRFRSALVLYWGTHTHPYIPVFPLLLLLRTVSRPSLTLTVPPKEGTPHQQLLSALPGKCPSMCQCQGQLGGCGGDAVNESLFASPSPPPPEKRQRKRKRDSWRCVGGKIEK